MDLDNLPKAAKEIKAPQIVRAGASGATNMTDNLLQRSRPPMKRSAGKPGRRSHFTL